MIGLLEINNPLLNCASQNKGKVPAAEFFSDNQQSSAVDSKLSPTEACLESERTHLEGNNFFLLTCPHKRRGIWKETKLLALVKINSTSFLCHFINIYRELIVADIVFFILLENPLRNTFLFLIR